MLNFKVENAVVFHAEASISVYVENKACVGFIASVCTNVAEASIGGGIKLEGKYGTTSGSDTEHEVTYYVIRLDYETSDDIFPAGPDAAMFLIPALNIVYSKSLQVSFNQTLCLGVGVEVTSWSLSSPKNFEVWYFED